VVLLLVTAIIAGCALQRNDTAAPVGSRLTGVRWTLSDLRSGVRSFPVPANYRAEIDFADDGQVSGTNGPNEFDARYRISGHTIMISRAGGGAAGTFGVNHAWEAMESIYAPSGTAGNHEKNTVTCGFRITADSLTIDTTTWTLTFQRR